MGTVQIDEDLMLHVTIWEFSPYHPGIATNRDGRLRVSDGNQTLIFPSPSPATFIFEDAKARKAVSELKHLDETP